MTEDNEIKQYGWSLKHMDEWREEFKIATKSYPCIRKWLVENGYADMVEKIERGDIFTHDEENEVFDIVKDSPYSTDVVWEEDGKLAEGIKIDCTKYREFRITLTEKLKEEENNEKEIEQK